MKTIKKIKDNFTKVAGSALLVGATVAGGAAMVSAQDNGSSGSLGDFPAPFVSDDGEVDTSVVVGETAQDGQPVSTLDVVSGVEIAGSLGNAAFTETEETVSVSGVAGWTAEEGVTLDRRNRNLHLDQEVNDRRATITSDQVSGLAAQSFSDDDGEDYETTHRVRVGNQAQDFDEKRGMDEPSLLVENERRPDNEDFLFAATATFDETVDFTEDGDMQDEEVEMFGQTYTVSTDSDSDTLVLFGDSETFDVERGEEYTATVAGNEHTFEVVSVPEDTSNDATVRVDGNLQSVGEDDTIRVSGQDVRVRNIYSFGDNDGVVQFGIGSEEIEIEDNSRVVVDGDRLDSVRAYVDASYDRDSGELESASSTDMNSVDSISLAFGGEDRDSEFVAAGESYQAPFTGLEFHYGGLNPDTAEGDYATEIEIEGDDGDDAEAEITWTDYNDNTESLVFTHDSEGDEGNSAEFRLGDEDGDFSSVEGVFDIAEDTFVPVSAGEDSYLWQATVVDLEVVEDTVSTDQDEVEIEGDVVFENAMTGAEVEFEFEGDYDLDGDVASEEETVSGVEFAVQVDAVENADSDVNEVALSYSDVDHVVYSALETNAESAIAFAESVTLPETIQLDEYTDDTIDLKVPSTIQSEDEVVTLEATSGDEAVDGEGDLDGDEFIVVEAGELNIAVQFEDAGPSGDLETDDNIEAFHLVNDDFESTPDETNVYGPSAVVMEGQDRDDNEHAYVFEGPEVSGAIDYTGADLFQDEDDDINEGYSAFGTHFIQDTDDEGSITLHKPRDQATSGAAITDADGALSAEGGGSGTVMSSTPTYEFASGVLDSDSDTQHRAGSDHLILVGGPSVNSLVADLADDGETWTADEYTEGEGLIQMIPNYDGDRDAVIVAGYSGEDTRAAGEFLANYRDHGADLEGETQVTISTETGQVVN